MPGIESIRIIRIRIVRIRIGKAWIPIRVRIYKMRKPTDEIYTLIGTGNYICLGADDGDSEHLTLGPTLEAILEFLRFYKNKNYYWFLSR